MRMFKCALCGKEHEYKNPKQWVSFARRHRNKVHPDIEGMIAYGPVAGKATEALLSLYASNHPASKKPRRTS